MWKGYNCIAGMVLCGIIIAAAAPVYAQTGSLLVIRGGTLIDPARDDLGVTGTVIVQNSLIISVRPNDNSPPPPGAQVIDASGGFVMPGIADMHNHLGTGLPGQDSDRLRVLDSLLDWGVTTTLDPDVPVAEFDALRRAISRDRRAYPNAFLVRGVFTTKGGWGQGYTPATPAEARALVRELKAAGSLASS